MSENVTQQSVEENENNDKMEEQTAQETSADGSTSEDTLAAYEALFEKQKAQIEEQAKTNASLQRQIDVLMRSGASVSRETNEETDARETQTADENYTTLAELGRELGKRDYKTHNKER